MEVTEVIKLSELEDRHWWYRERRALLRQMVQDLFPGGAHERVAIDIGAAAGGNTRVLRDLGLTAIPLEFGMAGAAIAHQRGLPALQADARLLPLGTAVADIVVAFDVLEHIEDDSAVLSQIYRVLKPGGRRLVAVPADMALWSAHDDAVGHVRRYSRAGLRALTEEAGFRVDEIWSWNVLLRGVAALRRRRAHGSQLEEHSRPVNAMLSMAVAVERRVSVLRRRRGISLLMTATRAAETG